MRAMTQSERIKLNRMREKGFQEQVNTKDSNAVVNVPKPTQNQLNPIESQKLKSSTMVTEKENRGASGATNQKLDIANESIQLAKDPNGKLPAESQIMGNVSSKVQSKENGSNSSTRTKSPQAGSANRREKIMKKNSSNILEEDQSTSDGEGGDNGPNKVKPRPKIKKWKKQARSSGGESGNTFGQIGTKRPSSELTWPSPNSKRIKTLSHLKQPHRRNSLSSHKAKLQLKLIDTKQDAVVGLEHMDEAISAGAGSQPRWQS